MNIGALSRCALFRQREFARLVRDPNQLAKNSSTGWDTKTPEFFGHSNAPVSCAKSRAASNGRPTFCRPTAKHFASGICGFSSTQAKCEHFELPSATF